MARFDLEEVRALQKHGPYFLGGYCFGGNVAYEMARQLEMQGEKDAFLAVLDAAPANGSYERVPWWQPSYPFKFALNLYYWFQSFWSMKPHERFEFVLRKA